jgi:hypothetical protein
MRDVMNKVIDKDHKQYLVACIVSQRELDEGTFLDLFSRAEHQFHSLLNRKIDASKRYFQFERFIFLMNYKDTEGDNEHTEARLLGSSGDKLKHLNKCEEDKEEVESEEDQMRTKTSKHETHKYETPFLFRMRKDFESIFGEEEKFSIALFSHFLPCAQPDHMCAELIKTFAESTQTDIILSYEMPYMTTDEESCFKMLKHEKVLMIHPEACNYFQQRPDDFHGPQLQPPHRYRYKPYGIQGHLYEDNGFHRELFSNYNLHQNDFDHHYGYEPQNGFVHRHGYPPYNDFDADYNYRQYNGYGNYHIHPFNEMPYYG